MKRMLLSILFLLCGSFTIVYQAVGAELGEPKFIFFPKSRDISNDSPYLHPRLGEADANGVFIHVASVPFQDSLRVFLCRSDGDNAPGKWSRDAFFDAPNPTPTNRKGMPAYGGGGVSQPNAVFADGAKFAAYLPPDAKPIGSEEWRYHMRWERVHGNYYAVTIYRDIDIIRNGLFTEENGRDLSSPLGESSATQPFPWEGGTFATDLGHKIEIYYGFPKQSERDFLSLVEVKEDQLPEDFPKGLVLWLK